MPTPAKPIRRNMARVEFLACMEAIEELLAQGFSKRLAYERMLEKGRISMAYITFCKLTVKAAKNDLHVASLRPVSKPVEPHPPTPPTPAPPRSLQQSQPNVIKAPADELQDPRNIDPKSII